LNALAADASGTLEVSPCWKAMIQCVMQQLYHVAHFVLLLRASGC